MVYSRAKKQLFFRNCVNTPHISNKDMANLQLLANEAMQLSAQGDHLGAAAKYDAILEIDASVAEVHLNKGVSLTRGGKQNEALESFRKASELKPELIAAYANMGNLLKQLGRHEEAVEVYRKTVELNENAPQYWSNLAHELNEIEDFEGALEAASNGIEKNNTGKTYVPLHNERLFAFFKQGHPDQAIDDVEAILETTPFDQLDQPRKQLYCMIFAQAGVRFMNDGDNAKAAQLLKRSCDEDPDGENHLIFAVCLIQDDKDEQALKILEHALTLNPSNWKMYIAQGTVHMKSRNFEKAVESFEKAMASPQAKVDVSANFNCAVALMNLGRNAEAKPLLEFVVAMEPDNWIAMSLLGTIYLSEKEYEKAISVFEPATKIPGAEADSSLFYNYGYALLMQDQAEKALPQFEMALKIDPTSTQAASAVSVLTKPLETTETVDAQEVQNLQTPLEMAQVMLAPQRPAFGMDPYEQGGMGYVARVKQLFEDRNAKVAYEKSVMQPKRK